MKNFIYKDKIMWSQVDANMHLRHSAYADFAAQARIELLESLGFGAEAFKMHKIGPILFREELIYLKELRPNEHIEITCEVTKLSSDASRWSFRQFVFKADGTKAAIINVDGAWIDTEKRKLTGLNEEMVLAFNSLHKSEDFTSN
ncbi:MAG: acyl-CoA thioesterase [bacterium]|nr:acyl-CoA thioesterase [bacterium]